MSPFEGSDRVERVRAEAYRGVPPYVEFVVTVGEGLNIRNKVVATFDGLQIRRITNRIVGALDHRKVPLLVPRAPRGPRFARRLVRRKQELACTCGRRGGS